MCMQKVHINLNYYFRTKLAERGEWKGALLFAVGGVNSRLLKLCDRMSMHARVLTHSCIYISFG